MRYLFSILIVLLTFFSCKKDSVSVDYNFSGKSGVFVVCEGNLHGDNASLSFYDKTSGKVDDQVFYNANDFPLGDVAQSMSIHGGKGYIPVCSSGVIYVIDINTGKYLDVITGLTSPRYICFLSDTKAYVTDLVSSDITIINPQTNKITGSFFVGHSASDAMGGTESIVRVGEYVYACGWSYNDKVYKIDVAKNEVVDSISVGQQPNSIVVDKYDNLWVLSDGGYVSAIHKKEKACLMQINTRTFTHSKEFLFNDIKKYPTELKIDAKRENLYFISSGDQLTDGVYKMSVDSEVLPDHSFIVSNKRRFYGLDIDASNGDVYVTDALDNAQSGWLIRFDQLGREIDKQKVGINPGAMCFK